ncbi:hypothetical protein FXO38_14101 [Capsicum annuum]|nr:hypothetical protein FXO38_14101 [Capsicum annuum]KAF3664501.1 hypothetical protein FXO37_11475 [Capsicum annuum]
MQLGCPNIKDLGFQGGDNLSEAIDLDDASLRFDCGYEILGSLQQSHPTRTGEDSRRLDCLVQGKILSVSESIFNHLETALKVLISVNCIIFGQQERVGLQMSSQVAAAVSSVNMSQTMSVTAPDSMLTNSGCNRSIRLAFPSVPVHLSISLSLQTSLKKVVKQLIIKIVDCQSF